MDKLISAFSDNIDEGFLISKDMFFKLPKNTISNVVICGMGGSGIGGRIVSSWIQDEIKIPVICYNDYFPPAFIDENTLLIASSYSGSTEETLFFLKEVFKRNSHIIGICSGGELKDFCISNNLEYILIPSGYPPRAAIAFSIVQILNILQKLNLISEDVLNKLKLSSLFIKQKEIEIQRTANDLAKFILDSVPIFYATTQYESILIRAKQQFNENSKILCFTNVLPEMNHNELVGWGGGDNRFSAVYFNTNDLFSRNVKRAEITFNVISNKTKLMTINIEGKNLIERSIYMIHLVDWASFYLSKLTNKDSLEIEIINKLKKELSNF